ncbi:hypothetical protein JZ751_002235 [Albula glossodonta]|uniref:Ribosomal RNA-processing protein 8 n=1 Tax=Albula glossodonta TaxID=121402 RepID=A0A8T2P8B6_9TELE|nr:hypothetical protein JZ751_002235 [Albula glossodonta]
MFEEEQEWNDDAEAKALTRAVIHGTERLDITNVTAKGIGKKKSLLRTLQTLGSVPKWTDISPQDAKPMKVRETEDVKVAQKKDLHIVKDKEEKKEDEKKLTRQQWRNKVKMKKKCNNKYRLQGEIAITEKTNAKLQEAGEPKERSNGEEEVVQAQTPKSDNRTQKQSGDKAQKRIKAEMRKKEDQPELSDPQPLKNKKYHTCKRLKLKEKSATALKKDMELEGSRAQMEREEEKNGPKLNVLMSQQQTKERRILAEKLRRMLHSDSYDSKERSNETEEKQESGKEEGEGKTEVDEGVLDRSAALRSKMEQRLESARFRYINEQLYTSTSWEARRMFLQDPQACGIYHRGYTAQVQRWPANPVDAIISFIKHKPASLVVADFGCGDCKIARGVKNKVHSFDLAPICDLVTVCDMADVPLHDSTVDIVVFCLSLMGTNIGDFLIEANRVLVMGGLLKIAEVASRFENVRSFIGALSGLGFKLVTKDTENSHFYSFEFIKTAEAPESYRRSGLELKPCVYKKR